MSILRFFFREGSPFIFSGLLVLFSLKIVPVLTVPENSMGMFAVAIITLMYMSIQMGLTAFADVGKDKPLVDMFVSLAPLITLIVIAVLDIVGQMQLSIFQMLGLGIAAVVVMMDVIFNTLVLFKMNRLANDFVPMR